MDSAYRSDQINVSRVPLRIWDCHLCIEGHFKFALTVPLNSLMFTGEQDAKLPGCLSIYLQSIFQLDELNFKFLTCRWTDFIYRVSQKKLCSRGISNWETIFVKFLRSSCHSKALYFSYFMMWNFSFYVSFFFCYNQITERQSKIDFPDF